MMTPEHEMLIMNLVVDSGSGRSYAMEAIALAKEQDFEGAQKALDNAEEELIKAHHSQTELIQQEARGEGMDVSLILVHSQDHIMTAMLCRDLAKEFVELYKKLSGSLN